MVSGVVRFAVTTMRKMNHCAVGVIARAWARTTPGTRRSRRRLSILDLAIYAWQMFSTSLCPRYCKQVEMICVIGTPGLITSFVYHTSLYYYIIINCIFRFRNCTRLLFVIQAHLKTRKIIQRRLVGTSYSQKSNKQNHYSQKIYASYFFEKLPI